MQLFDKNGVLVLVAVRDRFKTADNSPLPHGTELALVIEGESVLEAADGARFSVAAGDVLLFPRAGYRIISRTGHFRTLSVVFDLRCFLNEERQVFDKAVLDAFYVRTRTGYYRIAGDTATAARLGQLIRDIEEELFSQSPTDYVIKALVVAAYAYAVRYFEDAAPDRAANKLPHYDAILHTVTYMHEHLSEEITLEMLAVQAAMSRSYYCTVFKRVMGATVWDYLLKARVERAISLLTTEAATYSITEVQELCGFNSPAAFNRGFKRLTGKTPSQYRKEKHHICF